MYTSVISLYFVYLKVDEDATAGDFKPHAAIFGNPYNESTSTYAVVMEKTVVMKDLKTMSDAVCMFIAYIFIFSLKCNSRNTFEFLQKVMNIRSGKYSLKIMLLLCKLKK